MGAASMSTGTSMLPARKRVWQAARSRPAPQPWHPTSCHRNAATTSCGATRDLGPLGGQREPPQHGNQSTGSWVTAWQHSSDHSPQLDGTSHPAQHAPHAPERDDTGSLSRRIMRAQCLEDLHTILSAHITAALSGQHSPMDHVNVSATASRMAKIVMAATASSPEGVAQPLSNTLPLLLSACMHRAHKMAPRQLSTCMWAIAALMASLQQSGGSLTPLPRHRDADGSTDHPSTHKPRSSTTHSSSSQPRKQPMSRQLPEDTLWDALQRDGAPWLHSAPTLDSDSAPTLDTSDDNRTTTHRAQPGKHQQHHSTQVVYSTVMATLLGHLCRDQHKLGQAKAQDLVLAVYAHARLVLPLHAYSTTDATCMGGSFALHNSLGASTAPLQPTSFASSTSFSAAPTACGTAAPALRNAPSVVTQPVDQLLVHSMAVQLRHFTAQDCSLSVWSLATLGVHPGTRWLSALCRQALPLLAYDFTPQGFANLCWGLATLGHQPSVHWLAQLLHSTQSCLRACSHQELANLAWALPKLLPADSSTAAVLHGQQLTDSVSMWGQALEAELVRRLTADTHPGTSCGPESNTVAPLANAERLAAAEADVVARTSGQLRPQHVACVLRCLALLQHSPSGALLTALQHHVLSSVRGYRHHATVDVGTAPKQADSSGCLAGDSGSISVTEAWSLGSEIRVSSAVSSFHLSAWATDLQAQCTVLWSLARMDSFPPAPLVECLTDCMGGRLHMANASDLSAALYSLALLKQPPGDKWLLRFFQVSRHLLPSCTPAQLSALLLGLAKLRVRPDNAWMENILCHVTYHMNKYLATTTNNNNSNSSATTTDAIGGPASTVSTLHANAAAACSGTATSAATSSNPANTAPPNTVAAYSGTANAATASITTVTSTLSTKPAVSPAVQATAPLSLAAATVGHGWRQWQCSPREIAVLWGALGQLGYCPPPSSVAALCAAAAAQLGSFSPEELQMVLTAQAKLGLRVGPGAQGSAGPRGVSHGLLPAHHHPGEKVSAALMPSATHSLWGGRAGHSSQHVQGAGVVHSAGGLGDGGGPGVVGQEQSVVGSWVEQPQGAWHDETRASLTQSWAAAVCTAVAVKGAGFTPAHLRTTLGALSQIGALPALAKVWFGGSGASACSGAGDLDAAGAPAPTAGQDLGAAQQLVDLYSLSALCAVAPEGVFQRRVEALKTLSQAIGIPASNRPRGFRQRSVRRH